MPIYKGTTPLSVAQMESAYLGSTLVWQAAFWSTVSGVSPLSLVNAVAHSIVSLTQYGKVEQRDVPSGWRRVEYIHFDRASYFDSGIVPNTFDYEIETKCSFDTASSQPICAWGFMGSQSSTPRWVLASYVQTATDCYILNANTTVPFIPFDTDAHVFKGVVGTENNSPFWSCYLDGTQKNGANLTLTERWEANTLSIYIGGRNNNGTAGNFFIGNFYYHKVVKAGVEIQHLVPVKNNASGEYALFDRVSGDFLYNVGTGTLTGGPVVNPTPDNPMSLFCNNGELIARHTSGLPTGHTLVDRVWNAASTVAATNIKDDVDDTEYEIRVKPNNGSWYIFQSRPTTTAYIYGISGSSSGQTITFLYGLPTGLTSGIGARNPDHIYLVRASHKNGVATLYVKDETTGAEDTQTTTYNTADFTPSTIDLRFWGNSQNTINANNSIYHARLRKSGELVLDCVPVIFGNEAGLYDYVSGSFIGASQGTLTAGNAVSDPVGVYADGDPEVLTVSKLPPRYQPVEWLKATQMTDVGIKTKRSFDIYSKVYRDEAVAQYIYQSDGGASLTTNTTAYTTANNANWRFGNKTVSIAVPIGEMVETRQNKDGVWLNGELTGTYTGVSNFTSENNLSIAGATSGGVAPALQIYYVRAFDDDTLVLDCIPVRDLTDNSLGWYDKVSGNFYSNPAATYTAGSDIPVTIQTASVADLFGLAGGYADEQEIISGAITRRMGVLVLDGTETVSASTDVGSRHRYTIRLSNLSASNQDISYSTHFLGGKTITELNVDSSLDNATTVYTGFAWFYTSTFATADALKQFFAAQYAAGTPVIVIYPLATPTTEQAEPQPLATVKGTTNIAANGNINDIELSATYRRRPA